MAMKRGGLGRGLGALIQDATPVTPPPPAAAEAENRVSLLPPDSIQVNRYQPRHAFHDASIEELSASVREHGILQPLLVRRTEGGYELIAGERRLRAARRAGLTEVPALITDAADAAALELALVENIQREDLNPMEEAEAYRSLADTFGMTQDQIAQRVGKARVSVTNAMRLLCLPEEVRLMVTEGKLSAGHAKVISGLEIPDDQVFFARIALNESLSVRALEKRIEKTRRTPRKPRAVRHDIPPDHVTWLTERLHTLFGTSVRLIPSRTYANGKKAKGSLEIDFYSNEELDRILQVLGVGE